LPSKKFKFFSVSSLVNFGIPILKNKLNLQNYKKAGRTRNFGYKPSSRKCATNSVDHPHGGNTATKAIGLNFYGKLRKFKPTRKNSNKYLNKFNFRLKKNAK